MKLSWQTLLMAVITAQLLVVALVCAFSRAKFPKKGMRRSDRMLIVSAALAAVASLALVDVHALWSPKKAVVQASVMTPRASCATLEAGMTENEVTTRLGAPDRRQSDEETRGPGAAVLLYEGSRCAVHLFDGRVEFVD